MDGRTTLVLNWRRAGIALVVAASALGATPALAAAAQPEITQRPALSGTAQVGQRLEARNARWTTGGSSTTATLCVGALHLRDVWGGCAVIGGATGTTYTLTAADQGKRVRVWLTVSNRDGRGRRRLGRDERRGRGARADPHAHAHADSYADADSDARSAGRDHAAAARAPAAPTVRGRSARRQRPQQQGA